MIIEKFTAEHLKKELAVPVWLEEPENPPEKYVIIEKTGSSEKDNIFTAVIAVQSYAESLYEAARLNDRVKKAMKSLILYPEICRCKLNSDYNFTDTQTKRYRYQAIFDIVYYEE